MKIRLVSVTVLFLLLVACSPSVATPNEAATIQPTPKPTPTLYPTSTKIKPLSPFEIASVVFSDLTIETQRLNSSDGRCTWDRLLASSLKESANLKYDNQLYVRLSVRCILGDEYKEVNWVLVDEWKLQGLGYSLPSLLGWSVDGNYLYLDDEIIPDGCQPIGGWQENFRKMDLETGNITFLFHEMLSGAVLSPDTTRIVYYDMQNKDVRVYSLASGEVQQAPLILPDSPYLDVGNFTWSPDGGSVLFVMVFGDSCFPTGASILHLDVANGEIKVVLTDERQTYSILEWIEPNRVLIKVGLKQHVLDPNSGILE